jgi:thiamine kinase-like enzyme
MQPNIEDIVFHFYPQASNIKISIIGDGNINDTYRVDFFSEKKEKTIILLQRLNHKIFKTPFDLMDNWEVVADFLKSTDYPYKVPFPIRGKDNKTLYKTRKGEYWRVFPFFENTITPESTINPKLAYQAAYAYGIFLRSLAAFDAKKLAETIPNFHNTQQRWVYYLDILEKDPVGRKASVQTEIDALQAIWPIFDTITQLKSSGNLPLRATHNDTKAGNILLDKTSGEPVSIIDWDTIMPGTILSDFGDMVRSFSSNMVEDDPNFADMQLQKEVIQSMCQGFMKATDGFLTKIEQSNLFLGGQWIIGEQALRFFTDYVAGDIYYKTKYADHNLVRTRNQLALFYKITAFENEFSLFL